MFRHGHADLRVTHDFFQADYRDQRGVFHQDHEQVAQAGQGDAPHLRHDQLGEDPPFRQAQRHAGFAMALGNGKDCAAKHFRGVGAEAQAQRDYTGGEGAELQVGVAENSPRLRIKLTVPK